MLKNRRLRLQRHAATDDCSFRWVGFHVARAADALRTIPHDSKTHPTTVSIAVRFETCSVVLYRQYQVMIVETEIDLDTVGSPMLDRIAHRFLRDPI